MDHKISLEALNHLKNYNLIQRITRVKIREYQEPSVLEVLLSLLISTSVQILMLSYQIFLKIRLYLQELFIYNYAAKLRTVRTMGAYSHSRDRQRLRSESNSTILQYIAVSCPHICRNTLYLSNAAADAELSASAENCPQLEELNLYCP